MQVPCEALQGPLNHPTGKPMWQVYRNAERNMRHRDDRELCLRSLSKLLAVPAPYGRDECAIRGTPALHHCTKFTVRCGTLGGAITIPGCQEHVT